MVGPYKNVWLNHTKIVGLSSYPIISQYYDSIFGTLQKFFLFFFFGLREGEIHQPDPAYHEAEGIFPPITIILTIMNVKEALAKFDVKFLNVSAPNPKFIDGKTIERGYYILDDDEIDIVLSCTAQTRKELEKFAYGTEQWQKALQECRVFRFISNTDDTERWMFTTKEEHCKRFSIL